MICCINLLEKHGILKKKGVKIKAKALTQGFLSQQQGDVVLEPMALGLILLFL